MAANKKLVILILAITLIVCGKFYYPHKKSYYLKQYQIQFAYPVTSLNPTEYDDWQSLFIGNHIYYRLLPDEKRPWIKFITKQVSVSCQNPISPIVNDACQTVRIQFKPELFKDCLGRLYSFNDIKNELMQILNKYDGIVPNWRFCEADNQYLCIDGSYQPGQMRRLYNIKLRFGWSKAKNQDEILGAGAYCLMGKFHQDGNLYEGSLAALDERLILPNISFHTSQNKHNQFHLALYGTKQLVNQNRKNIYVHTPIAYYIITNPKLTQYQLPWNTIQAQSKIHQHFSSKELFYETVPDFFKFSPLGNALISKHKHSYARTLNFIMPDYLPGCYQLANELNQIWQAQYKIHVNCVDIVKYVYHHVTNKANDWDGILVGISASDPSKYSIYNQYFSPKTKNSWMDEYQKPEDLFYLVGIGQSFVTVDSKHISRIRPNALGLSDLVITDLIS